MGTRLNGRVWLIVMYQFVAYMEMRVTLICCHSALSRRSRAEGTLAFAYFFRKEVFA